MASDILQNLHTFFGHSDFRPGQEPVIRALIAGRSALAIFPTGGGKSLCYQLPALMLEGTTLVISPLIALMKDQVDALRERGIMAARLDSTLTANEARDVYTNLETGALRLLYIAPERLLKETFITRLARSRICLLAIDEAHCISEWGHNFRPEYLRLAAIAKRLALHPVLTLTATATPEVAHDIAQAFAIAPEDCIQTSFHRSNLDLIVTPVTRENRLAQLIHRLNEHPAGPAIVYVTLQKTAMEVAQQLQTDGLQAAAYHAGLSDERRAQTQDAFMHGKIQIIVATIAFGMGIDKADIRAVYHYNIPKTLENYQQEIGRAGRDGQPAHCELLACADDLVVLQNFIYADTPTASAIKALITHLSTQTREFSLSHYELSRSFDLRPVVLDTALTYLELEGLLEALGPFYSEYEVAFKIDEALLLKPHTQERQAFLKALFATGRMGKKWLKLDLAVSVAQLQQPRSRIINALQWLQEQDHIELKLGGSQHRYRFRKPILPDEVEVLTTRLTQLFTRREERDAERLEQVMAYVTDGTCLTRHLLRHFGEALASDCGHCSSCNFQTGTARSISRSQPTELSSEQRATIQRILAEQHKALAEPRAIARLLCGISSPALVRDKLTKHPAFGSLDETPFAVVLDAAREAAHIT